MPHDIVTHREPEVNEAIGFEVNTPPSDSEAEKYWVMMKPPMDWRTRPMKVATQGNPVMLEAVNNGSTQPPGNGRKVIEGLANVYRERGRNVLLFESSEAMARVTKDILGEPDPDDVFTVDYMSGYKLPAASGGYVNVFNEMTAIPRLLEHYVAKKIAACLKIRNVVTQPENHQLEGGDFTFLPDAITEDGGKPESLLVMGEGSLSRSNQNGRDWLRQTFSPDHVLTINTDQFHRDLVSVFILGTRGQLITALLALQKIENRNEITGKLDRLRIPHHDIPADIISTCALNLSVSEGSVIGMQSFGKFRDTFKINLPADVIYNVLPDELQDATMAFMELQGGANCVSGSFIGSPDDIDGSPDNIAAINRILHGKDFEDELRAHATKLDLKARIAELKSGQ